MTAALWWLAQNTLTAAVLAVMIVVASRWLRERPALQHALWLVVLVKFVTPPVVWWPWSAQDIGMPTMWLVMHPDHESESIQPARPGYDRSLPAADQRTFDCLADSQPREGDSSQWEQCSVDATIMNDSLEETAGPVSPVPSTQSIGNVTGTVRVRWLLTGLWLAGSGITLVVQLRRMRRYAAIVRRGASAPSPLVHEIVELARRFGIRPIRAILVREVTTPFVWCLGRLWLIWPERFSAGSELARARCILAHELAHVRRRDHWVAWLEFVAEVIWWWNPLFWFVRRRLRETAEMACDALALSVLPDHRRTYAELLLELSSGATVCAPAPVLGVSAAARSSFERRLITMLSERVSGKLSSRGTVITGLLALVSLPNWSLGQGAAIGGATATTPVTANISPAATQPATGLESPAERPPARGATNDGETQPAKNDVADAARGVAAKWIELVRSGNLKDSWPLTTKSIDIDGQDELPKLWNKEELQIERSLGSDSVVMIVTNAVRDNSGRDRAMIFRLLRQNKQWLIDYSSFIAENEVEPLVRGFLHNPGVAWHVSPSDISGSWMTGGLATVTVTFADDGTIVGESEAADTGSRDGRARWLLKGDRLVRTADGKETEHRVIWVRKNFFQVESKDKRSRQGYNRVTEQSDAK